MPSAFVEEQHEALQEEAEAVRKGNNANMQLHLA